jgi:hypothetical protein
MAGKWDSPLKRLVETYPQDFIFWFLGEATYQQELKAELQPRTIQPNALLEVRLAGQRCALHIEFQATGDAQMARRLWEYNVRATVQHECPVYSTVVYLKQPVPLPEAPYQVQLPNGQAVHWFHFGVWVVAQMEPAELLRRDGKALLPLVPLTHAGNRPEVVEQVLGILAPPGEEPETELLAYTYQFAALAFQGEAERAWLQRRFQMLNDILRESWVSQEWLQEGRQEGLATLRQAVLDVVQARFPELLALAQGQVAAPEDLDILRGLIVQLSTAATAAEAQQRLQELSRSATRGAGG